MAMRVHLYHGEGHGPVRHKVVVQAWQVGAAAVLELDGRVYVDAERMRARNGVEHLLALLLQQLLLDRQVLDDGRRVVYAGEGRDVVERGIGSQCARRRIGQERRIRVAEGHGAVRILLLLLDMWLRGDMRVLMRGLSWWRVLVVQRRAT